MNIALNGFPVTTKANKWISASLLDRHPKQPSFPSRPMLLKPLSLMPLKRPISLPVWMPCLLLDLFLLNGLRKRKSLSSCFHSSICFLPGVAMSLDGLWLANAILLL